MYLLYNFKTYLDIKWLNMIWFTALDVWELLIVIKRSKIKTIIQYVFFIWYVDPLQNALKSLVCLCFN